MPLPCTTGPTTKLMTFETSIQNSAKKTPLPYPNLHEPVDHSPAPHTTAWTQRTPERSAWRSISWRQASRASTEGPSSKPVLVTGSGRLSCVVRCGSGVGLRTHGGGG